MSGHGEKMARVQERAIAALLSEPTHKDAAAKAGIGEATLRRWLALPTFAAAYRAARREVLTQATDKLSHACAGAVETLESVMRDASYPPNARVTAARTILEMAYRAAELDDLAARVEELEGQLELLGAA